MQNCHDQSWTLIDDNLFEVIPESSYNLLTSSKNYLVFLQRKGLKQIASQSNPVHWPYSAQIIKKVMGEAGDLKIPFADKSTMSKDVSKTHSQSGEGREKWTKVFVPDEKPPQPAFEKKNLSILEEEISSIHSER